MIGQFSVGILILVRKTDVSTSAKVVMICWIGGSTTVFSALSRICVMIFCVVLFSMLNSNSALLLEPTECAD